MKTDRRMPRMFDWIKVYLNNPTTSDGVLAAELEYYTERAASFKASPMPSWFGG